MKKLINFLFLILFLTACSQEKSTSKFKISEEWKNYWYAGVAELSSYELQQPRYGEMREGTATIVFVTEDFSKSRHVKLDYPQKAGDDKIPVLKFNLIKKFITGIYDYTVMQSTFKPVDILSNPNTLRVTCSNIEWCGQFLTSARLNGEKYGIDYQSYFDGEENKSIELEATILEDEIWNWIRISPETLPRGAQKIIPGILTQELTHQEIKTEKAICNITEGDTINTYIIEYPEINRKLSIHFQNEFPYIIEGWDESFQTVSGWGMDPKIMTASAKRKATTKTDYWNKKYLKDEIMRSKKLKLD